MGIASRKSSALDLERRKHAQRGDLEEEEEWLGWKEKEREREETAFSFVSMARWFPRYVRIHNSYRLFAFVSGNRLKKGRTIYHERFICKLSQKRKGHRKSTAFTCVSPCIWLTQMTDRPFRRDK